MAHLMYGQPNQKPETFMLSSEAQQSLPQEAQVALQQVDNLKYFLISAPVDWSPDQYIRRFLLPTGEYVSCVLWNNLFHISGTDIVRCLSFRFQAFGRPVKNSKKFEEGIFSDLRNLKSGTDASLEEPKSPFLDFLYKNNCIRTQKKQKVFYWYSVPHDRLFLDALERDLKREKTGQEATTVAVSEPALSFEFDSSQSLFEQLTKAQQTNSSSFSAHVYSSPSPVIRGHDSMPPPLLPHHMSLVPDDMGPVTTYPQTTMALQAPVKREDADFMPPYNGYPMPRPMHHRTMSVPTSYVDGSPAPSFAASEDYSNRGHSFEPVTPPQQLVHMPEPNYLPNDGSGLYNDHTSVGLPLSLPQATTAPIYSTPRVFPGGIGMEGSPSYKQRRRRSSITPGLSGIVNGHTRKPSDHMRRSTTASVPEHSTEPEENGPGIGMMQHREVVELSRHGTPMSHMEGSPAPQLHHSHSHEGSPMPHSNGYASGVDDRSSAGPIRSRARSSSEVMNRDPYPNKSHSCPIPSCGRLFKRLEHLKRHVRTHTQERPYICDICQKAFSRSDNLAQHKRTHNREGGEGEEGEQNYYPGEDLDEDVDNQEVVDQGSDPIVGHHHHHHHQEADNGSPYMQTGMNGAANGMQAVMHPHHQVMMQQIG